MGAIAIMDEREVRRFRQDIGNRLAALDEDDALGERSQRVVELDQQSVGRLSRQDALLNQSMAKATQARRDLYRRALQAAMQRIEEGEFGYCADCGEEIAPARLELEPTVLRCMSCAKG
ncbi:molecular chaperone DnaK [Sagittula sp. P11]|nr:molecular chaperone DnaK [Sagittula sp. P11]